MKFIKTIGIFVSVLTTNAYAFVAPTDAPAGVKVHSTVLRPTSYQPTVSAFSADSDAVSLDRQSNSIRQMNGQDLLGVTVDTLSPRDFEEAALNLIESRNDIFGVSAGDVQIKRLATHVDPQDQMVSLTVSRNGLRIQDAGITLRFKKGSLVSLKAETFSEAVLAPSTISNTGDIAAKAFNSGAANLKSGVVSSSSGFISRGSMLRVVPTNAGYSLVKVDEYLVAGADAAWVVQVNTSNGELYDVRSKNFNRHGKTVASVYPRYYAEQLITAPLAHALISDSRSPATDESGNFESHDTTTAPKMDSLNGNFVTVHNEAGANLTGASVVDGSNWLLSFATTHAPVLWDNNDMAQTMVYVNTNKVIQLAKKYISSEWLSKPLETNVNHSQHCNAFWDGNSLNFFSAGVAGTANKTCANSGLISDVVFHEWGHGLDHNTGGIEDGALSEGFGDAMAILFTDDSKIGTEFFPIDHKPVRDVSVLKVFPTDIVNEVHKDGMIIAGTWFDLYNGLKAKLGKTEAKDVYAKFLFKGIYSAQKMSDVYEATLTLDDNDGDRANKTPNFCVINAAFTRHGLAVKDGACP
jgi:hypothetical protein